MNTVKTEPVVQEVIVNATAAKVWKAITDKEEMKQWYFDLEEFKAEPGFQFKFYGTGSKGEKYLHLCEVKEVIKEKKLSYSWRYDNLPGDSLVTFELFEEEGKTRVRLTHTGIESFIIDSPD
ncbi:MAG TPA: SRPBCC domain-containing protein, partial [Chitinophagaceae bacterium]|nr:SRPBCC domain-containing protein [Chitinophagaceae bacterium]